MVNELIAYSKCLWWDFSPNYIGQNYACKKWHIQYMSYYHSELALYNDMYSQSSWLVVNGKCGFFLVSVSYMLHAA